MTALYPNQNTSRPCFRDRLLAGALSTVVLLTIGTPAFAEPGEFVVAISAVEDISEADVLKHLVSDEMLPSLLGDGISGELSETLQRAYENSRYNMIWTQSGASSLEILASNLFDSGLVLEEATTQDVSQLIHQRLYGITPEKRASADVSLSIAWLAIVSATHGSGLIPEEEDDRVMDARKQEIASDIVQAAMGAAADTAYSYEPHHPQYVGLKQALSNYRDIKQNGGWLAIPEGDAVEQGDYDDRVPALRTRLSLEGFNAAQNPDAIVEAVEDIIEAEQEGDVVKSIEIIEETATLFDDKLADALKAFQARHGLEQDGVLGPNTLEALNESVESKIDRIADTMMRWREFDEDDPEYVWANIPSYTAEGWSQGKREISMRTIVGLPSRQTPTFTDEIEYVVTNPRWYAPVSIVARDKVPKLARDPGYASRRGFSIYDRETGAQVSAASVNWSAPDAAQKYRLVQAPGPQNALGKLKIIFPNQYSVYLHGTPNQGLFDEAQRAFSSGCVRLEHPEDMAKWLARHDGDLKASEIRKSLREGDLEKLSLERHVPVHITYMTVTIDDDGAPHFWPDIYDRDDGIQHVEKYANRFEVPDRTDVALMLGNDVEEAE